MALTPQASIHAQATSSEVAWLPLLTFTMPGQPTLRVVSNSEDIVSRGQVFTATNFEITLPTDNGETFPSVTLKIANVDGSLIAWIRGFETAPQMMLEIVTSANPNVVERAIDFLQLVSVDFDAFTISGKLRVKGALQNAFPGEQYDATSFPGLF